MFGDYRPPAQQVQDLLVQLAAFLPQSIFTGYLVDNDLFTWLTDTSALGTHSSHSSLPASNPPSITCTSMTNVCLTLIHLAMHIDFNELTSGLMSSAW